MISTLARITSYAAKGIYACLLLNGGAAHRKELLDAGYSSSIIHEATVSLEAAGFIIRLGGMYRVINSCPQEHSVGSLNVNESIIPFVQQYTRFPPYCFLFYTSATKSEDALDKIERITV